jgi:hypothetical protein
MLHLRHWWLPQTAATPQSMHSVLPHVCCARLQVKETATRMLKNFSVQASVNEFYTAQRVYKEAANQALPQVCCTAAHRLPYNSQCKFMCVCWDPLQP